MSRQPRQLYADLSMEARLPAGFWGVERFYDMSTKEWVTRANHECGDVVEVRLGIKTVAELHGRLVQAPLVCPRCEPVDAEFTDQALLDEGQKLLLP